MFTWYSRALPCFFVKQVSAVSYLGRWFLFVQRRARRCSETGWHHMRRRQIAIDAYRVIYEACRQMYYTSVTDVISTKYQFFQFLYRKKSSECKQECTIYVLCSCSPCSFAVLESDVPYLCRWFQFYQYKTRQCSAKEWYHIRRI